MSLLIEEVNVGSAREFIRYCQKYGAEHDDSYLPLPGFEPSPVQPSYLLVDGGEALGAASLLRWERFLSLRKARFSIFHSRLESPEAYRMLFEAIRPHLQDLKSAYLFIPENKQRTARILEALGFEIERYSFVLINHRPRFKPLRLPAGAEIIPLEAGQAQVIQAFADCLNVNFQHLAGHTENTAETVSEWFTDELYLQDGVRMLFVDGKVAGTLWVSREYSDPAMAEISALSVSPGLRGRGVGRMLLQDGINFAVERGFERVVLSVNAENRKALDLYRSAHFDLEQTVVCYSYNCEGTVRTENSHTGRHA
ncbi:MAG: GNAT family N-acetyltransferase [Anaerolineales bacterium]